MGVPPVPASSELLAMYAAYLARRLKAQSIPQYLNVVRLLHLEANLDNPLKDNWYVKSTVTGIERVLGISVNRKVPVTPSLLMELQPYLDMCAIEDSMFWSAALVMFYGTFRKSNLFPNNPSKFDHDKQFVREDFVCMPENIIVINVKYTKTIQFKERKFIVKLFPCNHTLCPVSALLHSFKLAPLGPMAPAFVSDKSGAPMTGVYFNKKFQSLIHRCGKDKSLYSSHSFRRGSAAWALQCGIPGEVVKQVGDWKSSCYNDYLDQLPQSVHDCYRRAFIDKLP